MKKVILMVVAGIMAVGNVSLADNVRGINIDFVTIGNAGNAADTQVMTDAGHTTGYGAVGYNYRIGKYEITNTQWNSFTAVAGAPTGYANAYAKTSPFTGEMPVTNVSWYEAAQFCNYLTSGDKSKGVYQFSGTNASPGNFLGIDRFSAKMVYDIVYFVPSENEWYKAAYYKPDGSGYSLYANGTNTAPIVNIESNYGPGSRWEVGSGKMEQNGTFDMMGNIDEWNETLIGSNGGVIRGGSAGVDYSYGIRSTYRGTSPHDLEHVSIGFRVATIPEPCTLSLLALGTFLAGRKRRK